MRVGGEGVEGILEGKLYCKRRRMGVDLYICNWYNYRYKLLINMLQIKIINMGKEYGFFVIVKEVAGWGNTFVGEFDRESYDGVLVEKIRECFYIIF